MIQAPPSPGTVGNAIMLPEGGPEEVPDTKEPVLKTTRGGRVKKAIVGPGNVRRSGRRRQASPSPSVSASVPPSPQNIQQPTLELVDDSAVGAQLLAESGATTASAIQEPESEVVETTTNKEAVDEAPQNVCTDNTDAAPDDATAAPSQEVQIKPAFQIAANKDVLSDTETDEDRLIRKASGRMPRKIVGGKKYKNAVVEDEGDQTLMINKLFDEESENDEGM